MNNQHIIWGLRSSESTRADEAEAPGDPFAAVEAEVKGDARERRQASALQKE